MPPDALGLRRPARHRRPSRRRRADLRRHARQEPRGTATASAFSISRRARWARAAPPRCARQRRCGAAKVLGVTRAREPRLCPTPAIVNDPRDAREARARDSAVAAARRDRAGARGAPPRPSRHRPARARRVLRRRTGEGRARPAEASAAQDPALPRVPAGFRAADVRRRHVGRLRDEAGGDPLLRVAVRGRDAGRRGLSERRAARGRRPPPRRVLRIAHSRRVRRAVLHDRDDGGRRRRALEVSTF